MDLFYETQDEVVGSMTNKHQSAISKLVRKPGYEGDRRERKLFDGDTPHALIDTTFRAMCDSCSDFSKKLLLAGVYIGSHPSAALDSEWLTPILSHTFNNANKGSRKRLADPVKAKIVQILNRFPHFSDLQVCRALDNASIELPERWRVDGNRLWVVAYNDRDFKRRISSFISKLRRIIGIAKKAHCRSYW